MANIRLIIYIAAHLGFLSVAWESMWGIYDAFSYLPHRPISAILIGIASAFFLLAYVGTMYFFLFVDEFLTNIWSPPQPPISVTIDEDKRNVRTVFFAGNGQDISQLALYSSGFKLPHGRHDIYHRDAANLCVNPWLGKNVHGNDLLPHGVAYYYYSLVECGTFLFRSLERGFLTGIRNGPHVAHKWWQYNFGQRADVVQGLRVVHAAMKAYPTDDIVLFGTSRGAAVALQVAHALTVDEIKRVRFMVLEGVFTSVPEVIQYRFNNVVGAIVEVGLRMFTRYNPAATTPLEIAQIFEHKNLPIAIVASAIDTIVDPRMGKNICKALTDVAKVKQVKFLKLKSSSHGGCATDNTDDRRAYVAFLNKFYNKQYSNTVRPDEVNITCGGSLTIKNLVKPEEAKIYRTPIRTSDGGGDIAIPQDGRIHIRGTVDMDTAVDT